MSFHSLFLIMSKVSEGEQDQSSPQTVIISVDSDQSNTSHILNNQVETKMRYLQLIAHPTHPVRRAMYKITTSPWRSGVKQMVKAYT